LRCTRYFVDDHEKAITDADSREERERLVHEMPDGGLRDLWKMLLRAEWHGIQIGRAEMKRTLADKVKLADLGVERFQEGYAAGQQSVLDYLTRELPTSGFLPSAVEYAKRIERALHVCKGWIDAG